MNLPASIRINRRIRTTQLGHTRAAQALRQWRAFWRRIAHALVGEPVYGNPLHEAWSADGEPLERLTPQQLAGAARVREVIVPHNRSR